MTTDQLITIFRRGNDAMIIACAAEAADRLEYQEERIAIMAEGHEVPDPEWLKGSNKKLIRIFRKGTRREKLEAANEAAAVLEYQAARIKRLSDGRDPDPGKEQNVLTYLMDKLKV